MFTLMKKYRALYFGGVAALMAAVVAAVMFTDVVAGQFGGVIFAVCVLLVILLARFCVKRADRAYRSMLSILNEECDPEAFIEAHDGVYRTACKRRRISRSRDMYAVVARVDHSVALSCAGQHREAIGEIHSLLGIPITLREESLRCMLHSYLAAFYLSRGEEGDAASAREQLEKARSYMTSDTSGGSRSGELTRIEYRLNIAEGENLASALDYFGKCADNSQSLRERAANRWLMGLAKEKLGDIPGARAEYEYVAQNAPKTEIGKRAAARLAELPA